MARTIRDLTSSLEDIIRGLHNRPNLCLVGVTCGDGQASKEDIAKNFK